MLCTFTIQHDQGDTQIRELIIPTESIKQIVDSARGTTELSYLVGDQIFYANVLGTARENMARLQREELDTIATMYGHQQQQQARLQQNLPIPPVARGKAGKR